MEIELVTMLPLGLNMESQLRYNEPYLLAAINPNYKKRFSFSNFKKESDIDLFNNTCDSAKIPSPPTPIGQIIKSFFGTYFAV